MGWMFMPLRRYADFSGRSRRMEFWMWQVFQILLYVILVVLAVVMGGSAIAMAGNNDPMAALAAGGSILVIFGLYGIYCLAVLIPSLAVAVRRLHDTDRSGWWLLGPLAPYIVMVVANAMVLSSPDGAQTGGLIALAGLVAMLVFSLILLVFYFLDGTPGPSRFGADPKGRDAAAVFA